MHLFVECGLAPRQRGGGLGRVRTVDVPTCHLGGSLHRLRAVHELQPLRALRPRRLFPRSDHGIPRDLVAYLLVAMDTRKERDRGKARKPEQKVSYTSVIPNDKMACFSSRRWKARKRNNQPTRAASLCLSSDAHFRHCLYQYYSLVPANKIEQNTRNGDQRAARRHEPHIVAVASVRGRVLLSEFHACANPRNPANDLPSKFNESNSKV